MLNLIFIKSSNFLPFPQTKISHVHDAVSRGSLIETQKLILEEPKKKLAIAKDPAGTPLLHKAVYHDHQDIIEWLVQNYPITIQQRDRVIFIINFYEFFDYFFYYTSLKIFWYLCIYMISYTV